jgi:hypothetical protein
MNTGNELLNLTFLRKVNQNLDIVLREETGFPVQRSLKPTQNDVIIITRQSESYRYLSKEKIG